MSISDIKDERKLKRTIRNTIFISIFCAVFAIIYECFSFEVYSMSMILAFLYPLCGGTAPALFFLLFPGKSVPGSLPRQLWFCGLASLTIGSLVNGVLEIYGTTNGLTIVYPIVGAALLFAAALIYLLDIRDVPTV